MIHRILEFPDPVLREVADPIQDITPEVEDLVDDMFATMHANAGIGLAAPQIGRAVRLIVIELPHDDEDPESGVPRVLINPELGLLGKFDMMTEGCLSLPGYRACVERAETAVVAYTDLGGLPVCLEANGLLAQAVQHEIDHLNGVLFFDHLDRLDELEQIVPDGLDWMEDDKETESETAG